MKLACINTSSSYPELEINKIYECKELDINYILSHSDYEMVIVNINNKDFVYPKRFFISIDEFRNGKINKILK